VLVSSAEPLVYLSGGHKAAHHSNKTTESNIREISGNEDQSGPRALFAEHLQERRKLRRKKARLAGRSARRRMK
jgi:hypothetical protein